MNSYINSITSSPKQTSISIEQDDDPSQTPTVMFGSSFETLEDFTCAHKIVKVTLFSITNYSK